MFKNLSKRRRFCKVFDTRLLICAHCNDHGQITSKMGQTSYGLCGECHRQFSQLSLHPTLPYGLFETLAFFKYDGVLRNFIHRSKISNERRARSLLIELFLSSPAQDWGQWADVIIAAPSSLWGRLRGRIDLAGYLAFNLAAQCQKPFLYSPLSIYGHLKKRALTHGLEDPKEKTASSVVGQILRSAFDSLWQGVFLRFDRLWVRKLFKKCPQVYRVLIVDDIVTTGQTIQGVSSKIEALITPWGDIQICKLALAKTLE